MGIWVSLAQINFLESQCYDLECLQFHTQRQSGNTQYVFTLMCLRFYIIVVPSLFQKPACPHSYQHLLCICTFGPEMGDPSSSCPPQLRGQQLIAPPTPLPQAGLGSHFFSNYCSNSNVPMMFHAQRCHYNDSWIIICLGVVSPTRVGSLRCGLYLFLLPSTGLGSKFTYLFIYFLKYLFGCAWS